MKQFLTSSRLIHQFYRSVVESTALFNQVCWYNNAKKGDSDSVTQLYCLQNHQTAGQKPGVRLQ